MTLFLGGDRNGLVSSAVGQFNIDIVCAGRELSGFNVWIAIDLACSVEIDLDMVFV